MQETKIALHMLGREYHIPPLPEHLDLAALTQKLKSEKDKRKRGRICRKIKRLHILQRYMRDAAEHFFRERVTELLNGR